MKNKKIPKGNPKDLAFLIIAPLLAALATWFLPLNYLESTFLFFGISGLYITLRNPAAVKRCFLFASVMTISGIFLDYAAEHDKSWFIPSIFHFRVVGVVPIENIVWFFLLTYLIISWYELFFDHLRHRTVGSHMYYLYLIILLTFVGLTLPSLISGRAYDITYFYLKAGIFLGLLPMLAFLFKFPKFITIFLKTAPYFMAISFLEEIVGLHKGYWSFPGHHFVAWVNLGGDFRFPIEELIFWIVLFSSSVITYFEAFDDNYIKFSNSAKLRLKRS